MREICAMTLKRINDAEIKRLQKLVKVDKGNTKKNSDYLSKEMEKSKLLLKES